MQQQHPQRLWWPNDRALTCWLIKQWQIGIQSLNQPIEVLIASRDKICFSAGFIQPLHHTTYVHSKATAAPALQVLTIMPLRISKTMGERGDGEEADMATLFDPGKEPETSCKGAAAAVAVAVGAHARHGATWPRRRSWVATPAGRRLLSSSARPGPPRGDTCAGVAVDRDGLLA